MLSIMNKIKIKVHENLLEKTFPIKLKNWNIEILCYNVIIFKYVYGKF